jgi:hypothetical protein
MNIITNETLDEWEKGASRGYAKSVPTLRPLSPVLRAVAVEEANVRMAVSPGWNFSGAVGQAVSDLKRGQTPCLDQARELMAVDPTGEKAAEAERTGRGWSSLLI